VQQVGNIYIYIYITLLLIRTIKPTRCINFSKFRPDPARKLSANLYDIYHCCVYNEKIPDDGQRNCPKHVEFYSKNAFEILVRLVGFIVRIYHDARSPERQMKTLHLFPRLSYTQRDLFQKKKLVRNCAISWS